MPDMMAGAKAKLMECCMDPRRVRHRWQVFRLGRELVKELA